MERDSIADNPLLSECSHSWDELIESVGPASLLVAIRSRLSPALRARTTEEDILQDSLLAAWRDRSKLEWRGLKSFRSWLLTIIDHRIRDTADREAAQKRGGSDRTLSVSSLNSVDHGRSTALPGPLDSTTPSRIAMYKEQAAAMEEALQSLPEDLQSVVRFRLIEQASIDEIAARLGIGPSAVRHRLYKGAALYRRQLAVAMTSRFRTTHPAKDGASSVDSASVE